MRCDRFCHCAGRVREGSFSRTMHISMQIVAAVAVVAAAAWLIHRIQARRPGSVTTVPAQPGEPLYPARVGDKWGYINRAGQFVIAPAYDDAEDFSEGLAVVGESKLQVDGGVSQTLTSQGYVDG